MKILQVNVVYNSGSTGRLVFNLHQKLLDAGCQSFVCHGRGTVTSEKVIYKLAPELIMKAQSLFSRISGYAYAGAWLSTANLLRIIDKEKPDIVHLHCLNGYFVNIYKLLQYLKWHKTKTVLTLHAEFMYTAGCGASWDCEKWINGCYGCSNRPPYWFFDRSAEEWQMMKASCENFESMVVCPVSPWLAERTKLSPFFKRNKVVVVENGIDTSVFHYQNHGNLKESHKIHDEQVIVHVTPNFMEPLKGGQYVISLAERILNLPVKIFIVGFNGSETALPSNVIPIKHVSDSGKLAQYYSMADLTLLTSKQERYSLVCAESLSCGTPVVGFMAGGPESIALPEASEFVVYGNMDQLTAAIEKRLVKKQDKQNLSQKAQKTYSLDEMFKKYWDIYMMLYRNR